ncbi:MAG: DNA polymerase I, partial [Bacteroidota bacterium]|nr:DNA polymerase I [Bacteroidota bacterium]
MALIYRAHFAFIRNPRINSKGINTSAVFGFTNTLLDVMKSEKPTHIGIVYDTDKPTFRHTDFAAYKANRQERPEDITIAFPFIQKMAEGFGIPNLWLDGYEADDVIGTLAKKAAREGYSVYMLTPDKDFGQLVEENIYQYKPSALGKPREILGEKEICARWEINTTAQVIDILGLMGDSIDNIPGVPGVGEKTAKKLIQEYGSVESVVENAEKIKGKLGESIRQFAQQALLSKQLATICIDCPVDFDPAALHLDEPDYPLLKDLFEELEFRAMATRVFSDKEARQALQKAEKSPPENTE